MGFNPPPPHFVCACQFGNSQGPAFLRTLIRPPPPFEEVLDRLLVTVSLPQVTDFGMVMLMHRLRVQCTGRPGCYCKYN